MKKLILLVSLFVASLASAATLTVAQALELRAGATALDGQTQVVPQGESPAKIVLVPYKLTGDTRWKIASVLTALKPLLDTFDSVRQSVAKSTGADVDPKNEAKAAAFSTEINTQLQRKDEVKLPVLTKAELNLNDNPIPGSVLAALQPIIKQD
jgi:hypothetical protein